MQNRYCIWIALVARQLVTVFAIRVNRNDKNDNNFYELQQSMDNSDGRRFTQAECINPWKF